MRRICVFSMLFLSTCAYRLCAQQAASFDGKAAATMVENYLRRNAVPGAVVVVTDGDEIVYEAGFGRDSEGNPLTAHSPLPIASLSKSITATAVMQLVDQHRIDLDRPVVLYLPEFRLADERFRTITVRQLLTHTSGLSDRTFREKSIAHTPTDLQYAVASMRTARLASAPGTKRSYHNPNYWVAARLVEVVGKQPFAEYLRQHIFLAANMTESRTVVALQPDVNLTKGHIRLLSFAIPRQEPAWFLGGCCGVLSTAHDLGNWLIAQNSPTNPLTSEESLRAMHQGMGWNRVADGGHPIISHNGVMFTYSAQQYLLPDVKRKIGIAVVANVGLGLAPLPAEEIAQNIQRLVRGQPVESSIPMGSIVDACLLMLALATMGFVLWKLNRPVTASGPGLAISLLCAACFLVLLFSFPVALRLLTARDLDTEQTLLVVPFLLLWLATMTVSSCVVSFRRYKQHANSRSNLSR
jgi:CubicO group peptidase (beta-lactamase class C family)